MKRLDFPPLTLGIDQLSDDTAIPKGAVRDAVNVDLDRAGNVERRSGFRRVAVAPLSSPAHSLWASPSGRGLFLCEGATLCRMSGTSIEALFTLNSADPVDFTEHNGAIYFSNRSTIGWIPPDSDTPLALGVPVPQAPRVSASTSGGLRAGRYTVALTLVDDRGEESGSSDYVQIELAAPGGILLTGLPANGTIRVYLSPPSGEGMYLNETIPGGLGQYLLGSPRQLKALETGDMVPLPPGDIIRALAGRVYTATGRYLRFSEPFRFGLTRLHTGFVTMPADITIVEPTAEGVYVGAGDAVWFLDGDPSKAQLRRVHGAAAFHRSSLTVSGGAFKTDKIPGDAPVAVWLSSEGYVAGTPDGAVVTLQADRIRLAATGSAPSVYGVRGGVKQILTPYTT